MCVYKETTFKYIAQDKKMKQMQLQKIFQMDFY